MTEWMMAFLASLAAGFLSALGLGGGGVLVLDQAKAGGINLLFFLPAALVAVCIHLRQGRIDWRTALRCLPFGVAAALLGSWLAAFLDSAWLSKGFAVLILVMGVRELMGKKREEDGEE